MEFPLSVDVDEEYGCTVFAPLKHLREYVRWPFYYRRLEFEGQVLERDILKKESFVEKDRVNTLWIMGLNVEKFQHLTMEKTV